LEERDWYAARGGCEFFGGLGWGGDGGFFGFREEVYWIYTWLCVPACVCCTYVWGRLVSFCEDITSKQGCVRGRGVNERFAIFDTQPQSRDTVSEC